MTLPADTPVTRTLVIPMADEEGRIASSIEALANSSLNRAGFEILLVDDGSTDSTADVAATALETSGLHGEVLRLERNVGKGGAVRAGMAAARGAAVAFSDADLSAPPEEIERCFEVLERGEGDVVVTTRLHADSLIPTPPPLARRWGGRLLRELIRRLATSRYDDTQCGLKAFTRDAARTLFRDLTVQRFAFDVEILLRAELDRLRVVELPIEWHHRESSTVRPVRDGMRMVVDVVRLRRSLRSRATRPADSPSMDDSRFPVMARLEQRHWWFRAKRDLVVDELRHGPAGGAAADIGCGTGAMTATLQDIGFAPVVGTDASATALVFASTNRAGAYVSAMAEGLPLADGTLTCLTSLDVVEHLDDDVAALREYRRVVAPGGVIVLAVPAYKWAWSDHDVALGHRRRYTRASIERSARLAGLTVERSTYFHSWLVPAALLLRRTPLRLLVRGSAEEASFVGPTANRVLVALTALERRVARRVRLPFGLSVLLVARVPAPQPPRDVRRTVAIDERDAVPSNGHRVRAVAP